MSYAIGVAKPLSLSVETYGTGSKSNAELLGIIDKNFDLRPGVIIRYNNNYTECNALMQCINAMH